ncbi:AAA family ATPase [Hyperthermus butylicus]|uniref:MoxR ATPase n=1 Tax=Hyperthermus butylicus (strain DSM 5456 / JCM 9403 / PLM1-5) TaxID=415426 RepID=A2BMV4_HYPBU|nr:MoxR family ATPase [Hyperthermus butylicus]ABM81315.1 putative MoxR ATPase [Hyperthermus butylicus DSM 5456]
MSESSVVLDRARMIIQRVVEEVSKAVVGKRNVVDLMVAAIAAGGHVLLEGVPGVAKTLLSRAVASAFNVEFSRVQCTPDLLPSDIIGTFVYRDGRFEFVRGPIFADIVLVDEINRASPKTQSALLEAMQERQVTVWGKTFRLPDTFTVIATMNPVESEGVYPLSEAQVDRFLAKIPVGYPSREELVEIMERVRVIEEEWPVRPVASRDDLLFLRKAVWNVYVDYNVKLYIASIVEETRRSPHVLLGGSPRAAIAMMQLSRALALIEGRDHVTPEHVKRAARPALLHRIVLRPEARLAGVTVDDIIDSVLERVEPP